MAQLCISFFLLLTLADHSEDRVRHQVFASQHQRWAGACKHAYPGRQDVWCLVNFVKVRQQDSWFSSALLSPFDMEEQVGAGTLPLISGAHEDVGRIGRKKMEEDKLGKERAKNLVNREIEENLRQDFPRCRKTHVNKLIPNRQARNNSGHHGMRPLSTNELHFPL